MSRNRNAVVSMISCSLLIITSELNAQEVNSDVKIPPPREVVISAPRVGVFGGQGGTDLAIGQAFQATLTPTNAGTMTQGQARGQIGDFMVSLLMKAGMVSFDNVAARTAGSQSGSPDGARAGLARFRTVRTLSGPWAGYAAGSLDRSTALT